jgi:ferrous iron transport protein A
MKESSLIIGRNKIFSPHISQRLSRKAGKRRGCEEQLQKDRRHFEINSSPCEYNMARINLRSMSINQSGTIIAVKVGGELGRRIREMGLVPGTEITIKQRAPLNDPVALRVMGGTLTLRNNEADFIEVEV